MYHYIFVSDAMSKDFLKSKVEKTIVDSEDLQYII